MSFEVRYSDAQRAAIYELSQEGLSGAQIAVRCREGVADLDAFEISRFTANRISREEREARGPSLLGTGDVDGAEREAIQRAFALVAREIERMERDRKRPKAIDLKRLTESLRDLHELRSRRGSVPANGNGHAPEEADHNGAEREAGQEKEAHS